jgi:hypothetical protein
LDNKQDAKDLTSMLLKIADNCTSNLTVQQYVFTRIEEILGLGTDLADSDVESFGSKHAPLFTSDGVKVVDAPFLRALNSQDIYLQKSASLGLACLYTVCEGNTGALIQWINGKLLSPSAGVWDIAAPALAMLSRRDSARATLISSGGVNNVMGVLNRVGVNGNPQQVYELCFIMWTLSLGCESEATVNAFYSAGVIRTFVDLIAAAPSRKIVRMAIATLHNIAKSENDDVLTEMLTSGLQKLLENMLASNAFKQGNDPEVEADVKTLNDVLLKNFRELSTFDRWVSEVHTGALRYSIQYSVYSTICSIFYRTN